MIVEIVTSLTCSISANILGCWLTVVFIDRSEEQISRWVKGWKTKSQSGSSPTIYRGKSNSIHLGFGKSLACRSQKIKLWFQIPPNLPIAIEDGQIDVKLPLVKRIAAANKRMSQGFHIQHPVETISARTITLVIRSGRAMNYNPAIPRP